MTTGAARSRRAYSVPVHQYDCFDPARPACQTGTLRVPRRVHRRSRKSVMTDGRSTRWRIRSPERRRRQASDREDRRGRRRVGLADGDARAVSTDRSAADGASRGERGAASSHVSEAEGQFHLVNLHFNNYVLLPTSAVSRMGIPGALREQADRPRRSVSARPAPPSPLNAPDNPTRPACAR